MIRWLTSNLNLRITSITEPLWVSPPTPFPVSLSVHWVARPEDCREIKLCCVLFYKWCGCVCICVHVVHSAAWPSSCGDICCFSVITAYPLLSPTTRDKTHTHSLFKLFCIKKGLAQSSYCFSFSLILFAFLTLWWKELKVSSRMPLYKYRLLWLCCGYRLCHSLSVYTHSHTPQSLGHENACFMNEFRPHVNF